MEFESGERQTKGWNEGTGDEKRKEEDVGVIRQERKERRGGERKELSEEAEKKRTGNCWKRTTG